MAIFSVVILFAEDFQQYSEGRGLAQLLCSRAGEGIKLASKVVASAGLRVNRPSEISLHTVELTIGVYVSTFLKIAEDTCHRKADKTSIISLIGALGGLAAVSHILFEDAFGAVNDVEGSLSTYSLDCDVEAVNLTFQQEMKDLEKKFLKASDSEACELLPFTVLDAIARATRFITLMVRLRDETLAHISAELSTGSLESPPKDWEPDASAEMGPDS